LVPHLPLYLTEEQLPLYSRSRMIGDCAVDKKMTIHQMNRYICISFPAKCMSKFCVSVYEKSYDMKPEKDVVQVT
jgi:hypothetical protein